ncbi:hypothetical protein D3C86_2068870 [compost metagenome]
MSTVEEQIRFGQKPPVIAPNELNAGNNKPTAVAQVGTYRQHWIDLVVLVIKPEDRRE